MFQAIEFPFHFQWSCLQDVSTYSIIRIKLIEDGALEVILSDAKLILLTCDSENGGVHPLHPIPDFQGPDTEGLRTFIHTYKLKKALLQNYHAL